MKELGIGFFIVVLAGITSVILRDYNYFYKITGAVGIGALGLSALLSGALLSGDRLARNLYSETKEDRNERNALTNSILLIGIPNIFVAAINFFL